MTTLVPLPVAIPLIAAGFALVFGRRPRIQALITTAAISAVFAVSIALMVISHNHGPQVVNVGAWGAPVGIALVVDRLSALMLAVSAIVLLGVLIYALAQGIADGPEGAPLTIFHPTYLVLAAGVANAFISGDLFNIYVGFEILLAASFVLLTLG
ncbi:MAG TPA: Na+/H+ antiporter subunit D, partial [Beutenbergiaceae bacterium]|nr:Na+/H+ antiporter subunit D [Beutenbergiaceae bacterium]